MKNVIMIVMLMLSTVSYSYGGECASGACSVPRLPRRVVSLTTEVVNVPVAVTTRTVNRVRRFGRRVVCGPTVTCETVTK